MKKLLIIESCDIYAESLTAVFAQRFQVRCCADPALAPSVLRSFHPDYLIINLSLKGSDGLTVLQQSTYVPPVVLALTSVVTPFVTQAAKEAGVGQILQHPCSAESVSWNLNNMIRIYHLPYQQPDPQTVIRNHLRILGMQEHLAGFRQLCVGIPLYAQDPRQSFSKELYPAIASICGNDNGSQVEICMRRLISQTWAHRNRAIWDEYFPDLHRRPTNRVFFSLLVQKLDLQSLQILLAQNQ